MANHLCTTHHQNATSRLDPKGYCHTHGYKVWDTTAKPANIRNLGIKTMPLDKIQWEATNTTKDGNPNDGAQQQGPEDKKQIIK